MPDKPDDDDDDDDGNAKRASASMYTEVSAGKTRSRSGTRPLAEKTNMKATS